MNVSDKPFAIVIYKDNKSHKKKELDDPDRINSSKKSDCWTAGEKKKDESTD